MKLIVVDASVILKWVFPPDTEAYQIEARRLGAALGNGEMVCALPTLWYYEVENILSRRHPEKQRCSRKQWRISASAASHHK